MAEILGLGCTHWPTLCLPNERLTDVFKRVLDAPNVDPARKDPAMPGPCADYLPRINDRG